jgi:hypothetical protein
MGDGFVRIMGWNCSKGGKFIDSGGACSVSQGEQLGKEQAGERRAR